MHSSLTAFVYLTDQMGRIRWRCHGTPTREELATMVRLTTQLQVEGAQAAKTSNPSREPPS